MDQKVPWYIRAKLKIFTEFSIKNRRQHWITKTGRVDQGKTGVNCCIDSEIIALVSNSTFVQEGSQRQDWTASQWCDVNHHN